MSKSVNAGRWLPTLLALIGLAGCSSPSAGTNTGNGAPLCPYLGPCSDPVSAVGPDGRSYRGRVFPDTTIASDPTAQSDLNPPIATLDFLGAAVDEVDDQCSDNWPEHSDGYQIQIFISQADGTIDDAGSLHVHGVPRDGYFASNPDGYNASGAHGWGIDLTLTAEGLLAAKLSDNGELANAAQGGANGAAEELQSISIEGPIAPFCGTLPASNGTFRLPCRTVTNCDGSKG